MINNSFYDPPPEWTDEEIDEENARFDRVNQAVLDAGFSDMTDACESLMNEAEELRTELAAAKQEADRLRDALQFAAEKERLALETIDECGKEHGPNDIPAYGKYILAEIVSVNGLGTSTFYEVISHDGAKWFSFAGSDTFNDGEIVIRWKYVDEIFGKRP